MLETAIELTLIDGADRRTYPRGTTCTVFNRQLHTAHLDAAEDLLRRAKRLNDDAGERLHLVMVLDGRPVLLQRDQVRAEVATKPVARPTPARRPAPAPTPTRTTPPRAAQPGLFD